MDREKFMQDCLHTHRDLLKIEREVHEWIEQLAGFEVARDEAPSQRRPPRPRREAPHAPTEEAWTSGAS